MSCLATTILNVFSNTLAEDFLRYAIGAGGVHLVVNMALRRWSAGRQVRDARRPGWVQMRREILTSLRTVLIFALVGTALVFGVEAGVLRVYMDPAEYGAGYMALTVLILMVAHDAYFYWAHRIMHHPRLYRRLHRAHHRSHNPTAFTAYSFDMSEALVHATFLPVMLALLPAHPIAIAVFLLHMILRNAVGHCGVELFPADRSGRPLFGWLTTVTHHDLHHENARWNMGLYFTFWDRLMGTEHPNYIVRFRAARRGARVPIGAVALIVGVLALSPDVAQAGPDAVAGHWATRDFSTVVRVERCTEGPDGLRARTVRGPRAGTVVRRGNGALSLKSCANGRCRIEPLWSVDDLQGLARMMPVFP